MTEEELNKMTLDDVIRWLMAKSDDEAVIEKINRFTFTFTPKYKRFSEARDERMG